MTDRDLIIGELREFKRATVEGHRIINERFNKLEAKVDELRQARWKFHGKVAGVSLAVSMFVAIAAEVLHFFTH